MSTCISPYGEFGSHELDDAYTCTLCGVLDEDALRARVAELEAQRAAVLALVDPAKWTEWDDGATLAGEVREALGVAK